MYKVSFRVCAHLFLCVDKRSQSSRFTRERNFEHEEADAARQLAQDASGPQEDDETRRQRELDAVQQKLTDLDEDVRKAENELERLRASAKQVRGLAFSSFFLTLLNIYLSQTDDSSLLVNDDLDKLKQLYVKKSRVHSMMQDSKGNALRFVLYHLLSSYSYDGICFVVYEKKPRKLHLVPVSLLRSGSLIESSCWNDIVLSNLDRIVRRYVAHW